MFNKICHNPLFTMSASTRRPTYNSTCPSAKPAHREAKRRGKVPTNGRSKGNVGKNAKKVTGTVKEILDHMTAFDVPKPEDDVNKPEDPKLAAYRRLAEAIALALRGLPDSFFPGDIATREGPLTNSDVDQTPMNLKIMEMDPKVIIPMMNGVKGFTVGPFEAMDHGHTVDAVKAILLEAINNKFKIVTEADAHHMWGIMNDPKRYRP
jgi:hypothetical protein